MRPFRRPYCIRRQDVQKFVNGYSINDSTEFIAYLNIQPLSNDSLLALPEGERKIRRVKSYGSVPLNVADEHTGRQGDLLYYDSKWFECLSCVKWEHTPLKHYEAEFVILADQSKQPPPKTQAGGNEYESKST